MKKKLSEGTYEIHMNKWRKTDFVAYIQRCDQPVHSRSDQCHYYLLSGKHN